MSTDRPKRDSMSIEEATISSMWEMAAIVELLEQKGLCTKQDLHAIIDELRKKNPRARIPETAFPEPYLLTETENTIIDDILELLNKHGLTSHQSQHLLERLGGIMEMVQRLPKGGGSCDPRSPAHHVRGLHGKRNLGKRVREVAEPIAAGRRSTATGSADSRERPPHRSARPRRGCGGPPARLQTTGNFLAGAPEEHA